MLTPPDGLSEDTLTSVLARGWGTGVASMAYQAVGFGSHHWNVVDTSGGRWFVTVDELQTKRRSLDEPLAAMGAREGRLILNLIRDLKQRGDVSMILIAHNYIHVFEVADRVNLLRGGEIILDKTTAESSAEELTEIVASEYRAEAG